MEELLTTKETLLKALSNLPINNLVVIAAELLDALDSTEDNPPEEVQRAIYDLEQDVLMVGNHRLGGYSFLYPVKDWNSHLALQPYFLSKWG